MKISLKTIITLLVCSLILIGSGCGTGEPQQKAKRSKPATTKKARGLALIQESGCQTCHQFKEKLIGPAYNEVAKKYAGADEDTIAMLVGTIIKGGVGNWGEIPMTPHPQLAESDVEKMVRYILKQ